MKTIIVPTDFSDAATNAAFYAAEIARHTNAAIELLHVLPLPVTLSEVPLPLDSFEIAQEDAKKLLRELQAKLEKHSNDKLSIACSVSTGSFMDEIKNVNERKDIFAVIMGTSGMGAAEAFFLGSFSLTAARHLSPPLIVVPPEYTYRGIGKIGLACDMHNVSETVPFRSLRGIFEYFNAKLEVLFIGKGEKAYVDVLKESKFIQINLAHYHPEIRIITAEDAGEGLKNYVDENSVDMLIMIPKERNFVAAIFHRSVTKQVVLHPGVPVMILH